jgi:thymidylate synthase
MEQASGAGTQASLPALTGFALAATQSPGGFPTPPNSPGMNGNYTPKIVTDSISPGTITLASPQRDTLMLIVHADNAVAAWRTTLTRLLQEGSTTDNQKYYRDEPVVIELTSPSVEVADPLFPMSQKDLDTINDFIHSGANEDNVTHEWTKLYYHRMFDEPNSQVKYILKKLSLSEPVGEAQISLWDKTIDQEQEISPCTQIIWARKKHDRLEVHVHAHSSDAYKKLLMNLQEFISLQHHLASQLNLQPGKYYHFLDSCHIHTEDVELSKQLVQQFQQTPLAQPQLSSLTV